MPLKELKAYKRVELKKGERADVEITVPDTSFCYYDRKLNYGMHNGDFTVSVATSSADTLKEFSVGVREKKLYI